MKVENNITSKMADLITIITAAIAIGNFIYTISHGIAGQTINPPTVPSVTIPFRFVAFLLLETALAYAFGWMMIKLAKQGRGVPIIMIWIISIISAWTSLFNIQWLILGSNEVPEISIPYSAWLLILSVIAYVLAIYFVDIHSNNQDTPTETDSPKTHLSKASQTYLETLTPKEGATLPEVSTKELSPKEEQEKFLVISLSISFCVMFFMYTYSS